MNVYGLTFSFQSPSMLSLRGPEMEERADRLPPIRQDLVLVTIISIIIIIIIIVFIVIIIRSYHHIISRRSVSKV